MFKLITKWKYTWFAWLVTAFYRWRASKQMRGTGAIFIVAVVVTAALLMASGRWWGCFVGSIFGVYGIAEHYYKLYTNDLIMIDIRPLSLLIIACYLFTGWLCWKENRK